MIIYSGTRYTPNEAAKTIAQEFGLQSLNWDLHEIPGLEHEKMTALERQKFNHYLITVLERIDRDCLEMDKIIKRKTQFVSNRRR